MSKLRRALLAVVIGGAVAVGAGSPASATALDPPVSYGDFKAIWASSGLGLDDPNVAGNGGIFTSNGADTFTLVATCVGCSGYYLVDSHGKCMTVTGALTTNGAAVNHYTCTGGASNQWIFFDAKLYAGQTFYALRFAHSGKCAEVHGDYVGAEVRQFTCRTATDPLRFRQWIDLIRQ